MKDHTEQFVKFVVDAFEKEVGYVLSVLRIDVKDITKDNVHHWKNELAKRGYHIVQEGLTLKTYRDNVLVRSMTIKMPKEHN